MSDVVLQILLLLAYLAIGLIAVTFPIYAICVTFLPQEKWESEKERKRRIERLQAKISELTARLRTEQSASEQIKEEIAKCEAELKGTKLRVQCLTARGAVGLPVSYLALSLLMVGLGLYYFNSEYLVGVVAFGLVSVFFSAMAIYRLYKTISAVEYAALRPARTVEFNIEFESGKTEQQVKLGEVSELMVLVWTDEQAVENLGVYADFPLQFEIEERVTRELCITNYLNFTAVVLETAFLPKNAKAGFRIYVTPKKVGENLIPVTVNAKGIYAIEKELILRVVK